MLSKYLLAIRSILFNKDKSQENKEKHKHQNIIQNILKYQLNKVKNLINCLMEL